MNFKKTISFFVSKDVLLIILSSFLIFLSYPKISLSTLAFVSLVPFFLVILKTDNYRHAIIYGIVFGFFTYLFILYWIFPTLVAGGVDFFVSLIALFLLSLILAVEFVVISCVIYLSKNYGTTMFIFVSPSIWVIVDFIKSEVTKYIAYFPWFEMAVSQYNNLYILNLAQISQGYLITFIIVLINSLLASIVVLKQKKEKLKRLIIVFLVVLISVLIGRMKQKEIEKTNNYGKSIKVALIQPSIDFYIKWDSDYYEYIKQRIEFLLARIKDKKPDIIIWPENALYGWIDDKDVFDWLCQNIKKTSTYHIVGSVSGGDGRYVSAYLISPNCNIIEGYNKRKLVPFGEYVPMRRFLGSFIEVVGSLGEFESGAIDQKPFEFNGYNIAILICYETIFRHLYYLDFDVDFFVNTTNDGWYLNTSAPYQHFATAVVRAVENQRPYIRVANNGISAIIMPDGSVKSQLKLNDYDYIFSELKINNIKRSYGLEKSIIVYISFVIVFSFFLALIFRR